MAGQTWIQAIYSWSAKKWQYVRPPGKRASTENTPWRLQHLKIYYQVGAACNNKQIFLQDARKRHRNNVMTDIIIIFPYWWEARGCLLLPSKRIWLSEDSNCWRNLEFYLVCSRLFLLSEKQFQVVIRIFRHLKDHFRAVLVSILCSRTVHQLNENTVPLLGIWDVIFYNASIKSNHA